MAERLRAVRGIDYPADSKSLEIVRSAGGRQNLTAEQEAKVRIRDVKPGDWCDDLPKSSVDHQIKKGAVERVQVQEPAEGSAKGFLRGRRPQKGEGK